MSFHCTRCSEKHTKSCPEAAYNVDQQQEEEKLWKTSLTKANENMKSTKDTKGDSK